MDLVRRAKGGHADPRPTSSALMSSPPASSLLTSSLPADPVSTAPGGILPFDVSLSGDESAPRPLSDGSPEAPAPHVIALVAMLAGFSGALMGFLLAGYATLLGVGFIALMLGAIGGWSAARVFA